MNKFLDLVDRYKFSIVAVLLAYTGMFMYLQLTEIPEYHEIDSFRDRVRIDQEVDEIELTSENLEIAPQYETGKVTNTSRDMNDKRERSEEDYSASKETSDGEKSARETEQKYKDEARNSSYNKEVDEIIKERNKNKEKQKDNSKTNPKTDNSSNSGSKFAPKGSVMVEYTFSSERLAHQNNNWFVRNPGYTCGSNSSGRVVVDIKVGQDGRVVSAVYNGVESSSVNQCMQEQALKYAKISRFETSTNGIQSGKIFYTFVSQ